MVSTLIAGLAILNGGWAADSVAMWTATAKATREQELTRALGRIRGAYLLRNFSSTFFFGLSWSTTNGGNLPRAIRVLTATFRPISDGVLKRLDRPGTAPQAGDFAEMYVSNAKKDRFEEALADVVAFEDRLAKVPQLREGIVIADAANRNIYHLMFWKAGRTPGAVAKPPTFASLLESSRDHMVSWKTYDLEVIRADR